MEGAYKYFTEISLREVFGELRRDSNPISSRCEGDQGSTQDKEGIFGFSIEIDVFEA